MTMPLFKFHLKIIFSCIVVVLIFAQSAFSQLPDSIQKVLNKTSHDTARVRMLIGYAQKANNDTSVLMYANTALKIIEKNSNPVFKKIFEGYKAEAIVAEGNYYQSSE